MRTFGLIPAAGKSRRMGTPKLLLQLGGMTVLERVVATVRSVGVDELLVVVAPGADKLAQLATSSGAHVLRLDEDTPDMRATCLHGLAWIEQRFRPADDDGWLLLPADHPTIRSDIIRALLTVDTDKTIVLPAHHGQRGHPTLLRWSHAAALRAAPTDRGLNTYIREHAGETMELDWPSAEILRDLDTPEDYRKLIDE